MGQGVETFFRVVVTTNVNSLIYCESEHQILSGDYFIMFFSFYVVTNKSTCFSKRTNLRYKLAVCFLEGKNRILKCYLHELPPIKD
jgi:hypothetical protein